MRLPSCSRRSFSAPEAARLELTGCMTPSARVYLRAAFCLNVLLVWKVELLDVL